MLLTYLPKGYKRTLIAKRVKHYTGLKILRPRKKVTFHNSLPIDIMNLIYNNLDEKSIKNLSCVSRFFNSSLEYKMNKFKEQEQEQCYEDDIVLPSYIDLNLNRYQNYYYPVMNIYYNAYIGPTRDLSYNAKKIEKDIENIMTKYEKKIYNGSKRSKKKYSKNIQKDFNIIKNTQLKKLNN